MNDILPIWIYVLKDPRTNEVRYVGKTIDLAVRKKSHFSLSDLRAYPCPRATWTLKLFTLGLAPIVEVIEECVSSTVDEREQYWISHFKLSCRLTNLTPGGEGGATMTGRKNPWSEEKRQKISKALKGRPINLTKEQLRERAAKIVAARRRNGTTNKGRCWECSPQAKLRFRICAGARVLTESGRRQILAARFGRLK